MKKLFLILALFASLTIDAQSVYYYLPRNVIKLEVTVEETNYYIGPYAEFATEMLGISDYIKANKTDINVKDVDIQLGSEIDPNAAYYLDFDEKSKEPLPNIILDKDGILKAIGYETIPADMIVDRNIVDYTGDVYAEATEVSFIEILDIQEDEDEDDEDEEGSSKPKKLTMEDKAKIALEKIDKCRTAYFELVSGFQEVAYGNTLTYMVDNVKAIENEYISLFKGKVVKNTYKRCFYIIPEINQANGNVTVGKLDNGMTLKLSFETKTSVSMSPTTEEIESAAQTNKIFYRKPAVTNAKIVLGNETIASKPLIISQFGEIKMVPAKNNKIVFNPNTGQIISLER